MIRLISRSMAFLLASLTSACGDPGAVDSTEGFVKSSPRAGSGAPIVLVHAFHATTSNSWSLERVAEVLEDAGHFVYLADLPPYASTPARGSELLPQLDEARFAYCEERAPAEELCFEETKVHLIGHSQGGLDARWAVSHGYGDHTISVTTLSAPHRGTPLADTVLRALGDERAAPSDEDSALAWNLVSHLVGKAVPPGLADGFFWLSEARYEAQQTGFDRLGNPVDAMPDVEGVHYQSWAGVATFSGELPDRTDEACQGNGVFPRGEAARFIGISDTKNFVSVKNVFDDVHSPNDGHIPVQSAAYGTFLGCLPADHLDLIGRPTLEDWPNRRQAGFDYAQFHRELAQGLRALEGPDGTDSETERR